MYGNIVCAPENMPNFGCAKINGSEIQRLRENKWRENWDERKLLVREIEVNNVVKKIISIIFFRSTRSTDSFFLPFCPLSY